MSLRKWMLPILVAWVAVAPLSAQQPPALGRPTMEYDPKIDALLNRWERETSVIQSMTAQITSTKKDGVFTRSEPKVLKGVAKYSRPDRFLLDLRSQLDPQQYEKTICSGTHMYIFQPEQKQIIPWSLPAKQAGQLPDDGLLPFLFGMKAETAKKRYKFEVLKEDANYLYVRVQPLFERDMADFTVAMLSILKVDAIPRQISWQEPNKTQVTWDLRDVRVNAPIPLQEFSKPQLPRGWEWGKDPATANPNAAPRARVIRPQGK